MSNGQGKSLKLRALLTDTLPYEVPIIFANDKFHATLSVNQPAAIEKWVARLYGDPVKRFSIPYNYRITKSPDRHATLSVIHPLSQIEIANFYERNTASILQFTANDQFSLRRPASTASPFVAKGGVADSSLRQGAVQRMIEAGEPDVSHLTSYFAYEKYNLLSKFVDSREFTRLEAKFKALRVLDISKCFYNIYTHSVSWAIKDKAFAKEEANTHSFEAQIDKLMQRANYNETNGIVVGPEVSRIFAEIVLQSVDKRVEGDLLAEGMRAAVDYDVRRYVDDYYVFANSASALERVERAIRENLEAYKLYLNEQKTQSFERPFVSGLSVAHAEVSAVIWSINELLQDAKSDPTHRLTARLGDRVAARLKSLRLIVHKYAVEYANISGLLLMRLKGIAGRVLQYAEKADTETHRRAWCGVVMAIVEVGLFVCALDYRVRTTYSISQIAVVLRRSRKLFAEDQWERFELILMQELTNILKSTRAQLHTTFTSSDSVESYNLLICGAEFVGSDFLKSSPISGLLNQLLDVPQISYFRYITLKFCFLKDPVHFSAALTLLNKKVQQFVVANKEHLRRDAETFLPVCDLLSAPDIPPASRRQLYEDVVAKGIPTAAITPLAEAVGFVDWTGLSVEHLLIRKALRPVYSWG